MINGVIRSTRCIYLRFNTPVGIERNLQNPPSETVIPDGIQRFSKQRPDPFHRSSDIMCRVMAHQFGVVQFALDQRDEIPGIFGHQNKSVIDGASDQKPVLAVNGVQAN